MGKGFEKQAEELTKKMIDLFDKGNYTDSRVVLSALFKCLAIVRHMGYESGGDEMASNLDELMAEMLDHMAGLK